MNKTDGRKLDHAVLEEMRIQAVRQIIEEGSNPEMVIRAMGFHRGCIYKWIAKYRKGGYDALRRIALKGRPKMLNRRQAQWVQAAVAEKTPPELKIRHAKWTAAAVREAVYLQFGIGMSVVSAGRLLRSFGLNGKKKGEEPGDTERK